VASRSALIVANSEYRSEKLRRLRAPAHDADALARVLQDPAIGGFEVGLVSDQPEHVLRRRIARFFAERRRDDLLLLHISCHGLKDDDGHLFFAAADTEFDDLESTAVPEEFVRRQMAKSRSGRIVLLLDCCYSGAFSRGMAARGGEGVELKERFAGRGRAMITASNAMEYSFEGDDLNGEGEPSVFTRAVVKALETGQADRDQDGWIAFDELYDFVYDEVRGCSPQHPLKWVDLEGDLRIARSVYQPPARPGSLPKDVQGAVDSPERRTRIGAVQVLGEFLAGADTGLGAAARVALEHLAHDDSRQVSEAADRVLADASPDRAKLEPATPEAAPANAELAIAPAEAAPAALSAPGDPAGAAAVAPADQRPLDSAGVNATEEAPSPAPTEAAVWAPFTWRSVVGRRETRPAEPWLRLAGARAAATASVGGALAVIASLRASSPFERLTDAFYQVPVAIMAGGVIVLVMHAFYCRRKAALVGATGLALALLGVTFPLGWPEPSLPRATGFWVGACGAAAAAAGAALGSWLAYREPSPARDETRLSNRSRPVRVAFAITGPLIVVATLFVLPERAHAQYLTWAKWGLLRYPLMILVLCAITIAIATGGIWTNRRRWLVIATVLACLTLGEALPFIYKGVHDWGAGRWLRIIGALLAVAGLSLAAATTRPTEQSQR
jgi:Caspase domain